MACTGPKRGLETRVSLKQALAAQGFTGGTRTETEWNQWIQSEKEELALVMERHGVEWEQKGTHEKHLNVLEYEKKMRAQEVAELDNLIEQKQSTAMFISLKHVSQNQIVEIVKEDNSGHFKNLTLNISK